jgi:tetratricopeptide (TPR) repeat protein
MSYDMVGDFDLALEHLFRAEKILIHTQKKLLLSKVYNEIGLVYSIQENPDLLSQSLIYYKKFLNLALELENKMEIAGAYSNIAQYYEFVKKYDTSLLFHEKALTMRKEIGDKRVLGISYGSIGFVNKLLGNNKIALENLKKAEQLFKEVDYQWGLYENYIGQANYYLTIQEYDFSKEYADKAMDICEEMNSKYAYKTVYKFLANYYKETNKAEEAYKYQELQYIYQDSISTEKMNDRLVEMKTLYDLDKKENAIQLLEEKNKAKQKWIFTIALGSLLVIVIVLYTLILVISKRKKEGLLYEAEKQLNKKEKELANEKIEKSKLIENELQKENRYKSKQLTTHALNMLQKNKLLQEMDIELKCCVPRMDDELKRNINSIRRQIKRNMSSQKDWHLFKLYFEEVNKEFLNSLQEKSDQITINDLRLAALIKLNLNIKEAAAVLNIEPDSLKKARYRLRQKLKLQKGEKLIDFFNSFD